MDEEREALLSEAAKGYQAWVVQNRQAASLERIADGIGRLIGAVVLVMFMLFVIFWAIVGYLTGVL